MLLGQIVAISFASNLFFLAVLLSSESPENKDGTSSQSLAPSSTEYTLEHDQKQPKSRNICKDSTWAPSRTLYTVPLLSTFFCVFLIPHYVHSHLFLPLLAVPHILLFIPVNVSKLAPRSWGRVHPSGTFMLEHHRYIYRLILWPSLVLYLKATLAVLLDTQIKIRNQSYSSATLFNFDIATQILQQFFGDKGFPSELFDHPAVSSVGWDVILCWVSAVTWLATQDKGKRTLYDERQLLQTSSQNSHQAEIESSKNQ